MRATLLCSGGWNGEPAYFGNKVIPAWTGVNGQSTPEAGDFRPGESFGLDSPDPFAYFSPSACWT